MPTTRAKKPVSAEIIAKYFIKKAQDEGETITNKKLQKLLYYAQAWNLALNEKPLFKEDIEAWVHGPAIREVYVKYKKFGFHPIKEEVSTKDFKNIDSDLLDEVWRVYGKYDADYLEVLTHNEEPWQKARQGFEPADLATTIISHDDMGAYYKKRYESATSTA